jgi:deoxycytidylate deaminase
MADSLIPSPIDQPELFFALVGPVGTDLVTVAMELRDGLVTVGYELEEIHISSLVHGLEEHEHLVRLTVPEDDRITAHMNAGDNVRRQLENGSALAALAIAEITRRRDARAMASKPPAFLMTSLKHPAEVELLRAIYGPALTVISVYEPEEARERRLSTKIGARGTAEAAREAARTLIARDQEDRNNTFGQSVRKTFPLADFFLDASHNLRSEVNRLVHLLFQHPGMSPTKAEYAMFMAQSAALRSTDLSRQVGAVVVDEDGEVISAGCNEVPKPGGGVYWSGERFDGRDFALNVDRNVAMGREILREVFSQLQNAGWLAESRSNTDPAHLVDAAAKLELFEHARVGNLIEFGRVVHAEMNALVRAARRGLRVGDQRLYCTTFPCHVCARHIIGAGIAEVFYIEPYPKSLAVDLYPEAICLGPREDGKVAFRPFTGVAPRRYMEYFGYGRRKDGQGNAIKWDAARARPRVRQLGPTHLLAERVLCDSLNKALALRPARTS